MPSCGDAGLAFFSCDSFALELGVGVLGLVMPDPVVDGALMVPRAGSPLVFPVCPVADGSVGEGVVALVPPPDWLAGAGELCANAKPVPIVAMVAASIKVRTFMI
jgi:hypothetical protein